MDLETMEDFVRSLHEDIVDAMKDADANGDPHYRLGVRRLSKAFFDKWELFGLSQMLPSLVSIDVDAWYAGKSSGLR